MLLLFSCYVMAKPLWLHGLQHTRLLCPSLFSGVRSNSCPLSWWCLSKISFSVTPLSSCPQSFPASVICIDHLGSLRKAFLSLLAILWKSAFKWVYLPFAPLPLASLLFSAVCKVSSDNHFAFLPFFFWGWSWSLPLTWCHKPPSICLSNLIPWIYLSLLLYNHKGFDLGHTWMV